MREWSDTMTRGTHGGEHAGYRVVTLEADGLRVDHHAFVDAPVLRVVWPSEEHCHDGEVELLVAAALGPGLSDVRARVGDATVRLAPVGGWLWRGTLPPLAEGLHRIEVAAYTHAGEAARVRAPVFTCDPDLTRARAPRDGAWPQQQGGATHAGPLGTGFVVRFWTELAYIARHCAVSSYPVHWSADSRNRKGIDEQHTRCGSAERSDVPVARAERRA